MIENKLKSYDKFENIMFALICKYLRNKNIIGKFIRNVLIYHEGNVRFAIPDNLSPKDKTKAVIERSIENFIRTSYEFTQANIKGNYQVMFQCFDSFFSSVSSAFEWINTIEGDIFWYNIHDDWHTYLHGAFNTLKNKGIIEDNS
jgi:hypothetical protein